MQNLKIFLGITGLVILASFVLGMKDAGKDTMDDYKEAFKSWPVYVVLVLAIVIGAYPWLQEVNALSFMPRI